MPERQLRQRIRGALQTAFPDALVIGWPANMWTGAGWPDLLFFQFPLAVGLEVKQGRRSKPTPLQLSRHALLRKHRIPVYVVHTPGEALWVMAHLIERLPMAFDPNLLAELDAALAEPTPMLDAGPAADPEPLPVFDEPTADDLANDALADVDLTIEPANGTAHTVEEMQAVADATRPKVAEGLYLAEVEVTDETELLSALRGLQMAINGLTLEINRLRQDLEDDQDEEPDVPQTVEAPAPRRRARKATAAS